MPKPRDKEKYNAYQREYQLKRYHRRMAEIREKLGGKCCLCGSTDNLEVDHADHKSKEMDIGKIWSGTVEQMDKELTKCRLLCKPCHIEKTILERGQTPTKGKEIHGTLSSYEYCRCEICKAAVAKYNKEYRRRKKNSKGTTN
jgi:5-methylcytosine-specific restriction endonuclease McrA